MRDSSIERRHERRRSMDQPDTTIMSEIEYINILPDIEKMDHDMMDDSSFWKGSFVEKNEGGS